MIRRHSIIGLGFVYEIVSGLLAALWASLDHFPTKVFFYDFFERTFIDATSACRRSTYFLIVRRVWCQVNRRRLYENHELYSGRRVLTVLIIKLQWQLRSIRNKSEFDTVLGEEQYGQDENNVIVPARPSAELVACSVQLGHSSSWTVCFLVPGFFSL